MDRLPRTTRLLPILLLWSTASVAADDYRLGTRGEVLDDRVLYTLGGGSAVGAPTSLYRPDGLGVGLTWRANLMCGNMDLQTTLRNQLNGVTEGFQQIMGSVVQNATQAVMSLPALIIQRANPGLYELLSNGVMQGRIDYDRSQLTCQAMARQMAEAIGQGAWGSLAKGQAMQANLQTSQDAVSVVSATENTGGNQGVTWVGGQQAGGSGQPPIRVTRDLVQAGYNLLHSRPATDTQAVLDADCLGGALCSAWSTPQQAADWAVRVLGETEIATCDDCETLHSSAGTGLTPLIQETYQEHLQALQGLLDGSQPLTADSLASASSPLLMVSRGVVEALRDDPDQVTLARRMASETALSDVIGKALLLQRALLAGQREPHIESATPAREAVQRQLATLEREIHALQLELQLRQMLAGNAASLILERQEAATSAARAVRQGDPEPGRLREAQSGPGSQP